MTASAAPWSSADMTRFVQDYYNAWAGTDEARILSFYSDQVVFEVSGMVMEGKDALRVQFIRPFLKAFPGMRHHVKRMTQGPGVIVVEFTFEAHHSGAYAGQSPTGVQIELPGCGVYQYDAVRRQITAGRT